jgi:molybdate transport system substrate-binding protein
MPRRLLTILLYFALLPSACQGRFTESPAGLTVFAAASLSEAFTELGQGFEAAHPEVHVAFNFAGSQQLAQQIAQGAQVDVFASADASHVEDLVAEGYIEVGSDQALAGNRLVVVVAPGNPGGLQSLQGIAKPGLRLVLAAEAVPAGRYALDFLDRASADSAFGAGFKEAVLGNVMSYEENVKAVLSKVLLGEADAGIVYFSDLYSASASQVGYFPIPDNLNPLASYLIAPLVDSADPDLAAAFIEYALSNEGQDILLKYGFLPVR